MEIQHSCCVTGHRDIPEAQLEDVKNALHMEVFAAIVDGYTHFISGFADGVDIMFASIVANLKTDHSVWTLEAAIPYRERLERLEKDEKAAKLLVACDTISVVSEKSFRGCFAKRNQFMVDRSHLVIAVYDGREKGGTASTIRYAQKQGRIVKVISI